MGNDYMFQFRNVQANKEGGGTTGGEAMFSSVLDEDENEDTPAKKEGVELKRALARVTDGASIAAMERAAGGAGACIHGVPPCLATRGMLLRARGCHFNAIRCSRPRLPPLAVSQRGNWPPGTDGTQLGRPRKRSSTKRQ